MCAEDFSVTTIQTFKRTPQMTKITTFRNIHEIALIFVKGHRLKS